MATVNLREIKPAYFALIDLIREHRVLELGKIGPTCIPKVKIDAIAPKHTLMQMFRQLVTDGILGSFNTKKGQPFFLMEGKDHSREIILNCLKTAEEILTYKRSLITPGALGIQLEYNRRSLEYDMYRNGYDSKVTLSNKQGVLLDFLIENSPVSRTEAALACELTPDQISSALNSVRRKLTRLGFTIEETQRIIPRYGRGKLAFDRRI